MAVVTIDQSESDTKYDHLRLFGTLFVVGLFRLLHLFQFLKGTVWGLIPGLGVISIGVSLSIIVHLNMYVIVVFFRLLMSSRI